MPRSIGPSAITMQAMPRNPGFEGVPSPSGTCTSTSRNLPWPYPRFEQQRTMPCLL